MTIWKKPGRKEVWSSEDPTAVTRQQKESVRQQQLSEQAERERHEYEQEAEHLRREELNPYTSSLDASLIDGKEAESLADFDEENQDPYEFQSPDDNL